MQISRVTSKFHFCICWLRRSSTSQKTRLNSRTRQHWSTCTEEWLNEQFNNADNSRKCVTLLLLIANSNGEVSPSSIRIRRCDLMNRAHKSLRLLCSLHKTCSRQLWRPHIHYCRIIIAHGISIFSHSSTGAYNNVKLTNMHLCAQKMTVEFLWCQIKNSAKRVLSMICSMKAGYDRNRFRILKRNGNVLEFVPAMYLLQHYKVATAKAKYKIHTSRCRMMQKLLQRFWPSSDSDSELGTFNAEVIMRPGWSWARV